MSLCEDVILGAVICDLEEGKAKIITGQLTSLSYWMNFPGTTPCPHLQLGRSYMSLFIKLLLVMSLVTCSRMHSKDTKVICRGTASWDCSVGLEKYQQRCGLLTIWKPDLLRDSYVFPTLPCCHPGSCLLILSPLAFTFIWMIFLLWFWCHSKQNI